MKSFKVYLLTEGVISIPQDIYSIIRHEMGMILGHLMIQSSIFSKQSMNEFFKYFNISNSDREEIQNKLYLHSTEKDKKQIIIEFDLNDIPERYRKTFSASLPHELIVDFVLNSYANSKDHDILAYYYDQSMVGHEGENRIEFYVKPILMNYKHHSGLSGVHEIESIIQHELTHFIQYRCFEQFPQQISQYIHDPVKDEDDVEEPLYSVSELERDPWIKSELGLFLKTELNNHSAKEILKDFNHYCNHYLTHSNHFQTLKKYDYKKWVTDIKKFYFFAQEKIINLAKAN